MKIVECLSENSKKINKIVLSDTQIDVKKIIASPVLIKNKTKWQIERFKGNQAFHENVEFEALKSLNFNDYKQILVECEGETHIFSKSKTGFKEKVQPNNVKAEVHTHNKTKKYLINEGDNCPALVDLGVFTAEGKIVNSMYDKFKQINKFIEIIDDAFKSSKLNEITILDFGCGKSYLTFLVYYYFVKIKKIKAKIIGYDLKQDVVENCNKIAQKYGYNGLKFIVSDVKNENLFKGNVDMMITLHACDTATDYALNFAINNNIKYVFSVPCCQHEVNLSIKSGGDFDLLLKDGLIKERFSALLTDAVRVEIMRAKGYSVDVIEFVDFAHSPKNLMLRCELNSKQKSFKKVLELQNKYKFNQTLINLQKNDNDG